LKTSTITDPYSGEKDFLLDTSQSLAFLMKKIAIIPNKSNFKTADLLRLETSSPSYRTSWMGWISDPTSLVKCGLDHSFKVLAKAMMAERLALYFDFMVEFQRKFFALLPTQTKLS
jgi:hypothetical protein